MVYRCCAYNCKEKQTQECAYTFHAFPKDPLLRKKWIRLIRRKGFIPTDETRICSKHFELDAFHVDEVLTDPLLKPDAIPTLFDFTYKPLNPKRKRSETNETSTKRLYIENKSPHIITSMKSNHFKPVVDPAATDHSSVVESSSSGIVATNIEKECVSPVPSLMEVDSSSVSGKSSCEVIATDVKRECVSPVSSPIMIVDSSSASGSLSQDIGSVSMKDATDSNISSMSIVESQPSSIPKRKLQGKLLPIGIIWSSPASVSAPELTNPENSIPRVSSTTSTHQTSQSEMNSDVEENIAANSMHSMSLRKRRPCSDNYATEMGLSHFYEQLYHIAKRTIIKQRKKIRRLTMSKRGLEAKVKRLATLVDVLIQREICDR